MRRRQRPKSTRRAAFTLETLESRTLLHAGAALSGFVYVDSNDNGTRETGESGVPGVLVRLDDLGAGSTAMPQTLLTDDNGFYEFEELLPSTYQITKRQSPATVDGRDVTGVAGIQVTNDVFSNIVLADDQNLGNINFGEESLRPEFINIRWFFVSARGNQNAFRESIAISEELQGDASLAAAIRAGGGTVPIIPVDPPNARPIAADDAYSVAENGTLTVGTGTGVLTNDTDADGDSLTAVIATQPSHGSVTLNANGSFTYQPTDDYDGPDSFTYQANDGTVSSNIATVRIQVNAPDNPNTPFGAVTTGSFEDAGVLGIRTDLVAGAPAIVADHVSTAVDYTGFSNPPTYGPHHAFLVDASNNSITPRATGVYTTEQPDEDLIHNLEHGHVWISYNPALISTSDLADLQQFVTDGGTDTGVILTPRAKNTSAIALASWARLQTLESFNATTIRNFVEANRGKAPEGFIPSGQRGTAAVTDNLPHS